MSLVFLKSADDKQDGRYNPNKPYRFSNYLTNPLTIPPNSQVAYVSSQFLIDGNGIPPNEPSWFSTGEDQLDMFEMPVNVIWNNDGNRTSGGWQSILNSWVLSANEFGMDGDFSPIRYGKFSGESDIPQANYGFRASYNDVSNKVNLLTSIRTTEDQFNLNFNACRTNPDYLAPGWTASPSGLPGATVPAGLNFTDKVDPKFQNDCRIRSRNAPSGSTSFIGGNCYGFSVGLETNLNNARNRVYEGGANYYNTGFSSTQLDSNSGLYNFGGVSGASAPLPDFDKGRYAITITSTGMKKCVGDNTPDTSEQNNRGGHQEIGHLNSGGYVLFSNTNTDQVLANAHYTVPNSTKEGFTGLAPQFVGLHSIPYIQHRGNQKALDDGVSSSDARNFDTQVDYWLKDIDLNKSTDPNTPKNGDARYLIGLDMVNEGSPPNIDLVVRAKVLDTINGKITNSQYKEIGQSNTGNHPGLSIRALSQGVNTACIPSYTFDLTANYSINTYNTTAGRTPAALFFRFRWINKNQIAIEFTLSVDGFFGTYNNATDEPYAPYALPSPAPTPTSRTIRLDGTTTGDTVNLNPAETINFLDSGGAGGDYNPNENYNIVFVAPAGQVLQMTINSFEFEQTTLAYDRFGIRISDDGVNWVNISEKGFQSMFVEDNPNIPTDPDERIFSVPNQPQNSNDGWIFPRTTTYFSSTLGGDLGKTYNFGARYIQFRFVSDHAEQRPGWDLNIFTTTQNELDPRNKWCLLAEMNVDDIGGDLQYSIPTFMGDLGLLMYPIASSTGTSNFRQLTKGYFDVKQTNRYFQDNNNGGGKQYAPYSPENPYYSGVDTLGVLVYNESNPTDPTKTSPSLINSGYDGIGYTNFNNEGILDATRKWLGSPIDDPFSIKSFRQTSGFPAWTPDAPTKAELAYVFGFLTSQDTPNPIDIPINALIIPTGSTNTITAPNDIDATNEAFSNHIQISNLPVISSNGVVSSVCKTIYVVNSLCIDDVHDTAEYRYYCHQAPYPLWVDLNNLESIQLNKFDVLIAQDDNTEQKNLVGESQIVIMFRQKEQGTLPNSIPVKNISTTRTY